MKKRIYVVISTALILALAACSGGGRGGISQGQTVSDLLEEAASGSSSVSETPSVSQEETPLSEPEADADQIEYDVDLTNLSSTMVYSEVYNMVSSPSDYIGKTVKMQGTFYVYGGDNRNYYACIIADATACCAEGIEFELAGTHVFPDDYPIPGSEITVTGTFDVYYEDEYPFCQLTGAKLL